MLREDFQREVEDVFRDAAPRTMARRRAAGRRHTQASYGGIAVSGNNNTVLVGAAQDASDSGIDTLGQILARIKPWSRLYARTYSVICAILLAASLVEICRDAGGILSLGLWVRSHGLYFLVRAVIAAALLAAAIVGPYWLFTTLFRRDPA